MFRKILISAVAVAALSAAPALAQHGPGGSHGGGAGAGAGAGASMGGGPAGAALDARLNSMGAANASQTGIDNSNPNSALHTGTTATTRVTGRANSQGPAHPSATGIAHANSHSVLKGTTVISGPLTGLTAGMAVNFNGSAVGTVQRIVTSNDGTVRRVLVTRTDGGMVSLSPKTLTLSGGLLTTTSFRGG